MFRKDFETGRFPISKRSPVIGLSKNGSICVAYNRSDLRDIANMPEIALIGVWPGKKNTDLFYLNPGCYKSIPIPPKGHEDIDSAESIIISYITPGTFDRVTYQLPEQVPILCKDKSIVDYIKESGIRHSVVFGGV